MEGFEDLGNNGSTSNITNHAIVFMLLGLYNNWKQLVAYYLIDGDAKVERLVNLLMEVLDASYNARLEVVATMCDIGANNVKALKHLGVSEKIRFVRFHNQEVAAVFDPPHLLKFTHNLFLKHDVENVKCVITVNGK
jgi:hypothetical protein